MHAFLVFAASILACVSAQKTQFRVVLEWTYVNFTWPDEETHQTAMAKGMYVPENNIISGLNYHYGYYYLALPRMRNGVPATLARVPASGNNTSPLLEPFPSWAMNKLGDCDALQNVQNLEIDAKGQAWIIDGGRTSTLSKTPNTTCTPKLVIYDIKANTTIKTYTFPEDVINGNVSFLYDLVVDDTDGAYAYITDNSAKDPGIVVYSAKENRAWKVRDPTMRADPSITEFRVGGVTLNTQINVAGIALGPKIHGQDEKIVLNKDRDVFFSPISSLHLFSVSSSALRNETGNLQVKDVGYKGAESDGMIMDNKGVLYFGLLPTSSIVRWDSNDPFVSGQKVLARDLQYIQWPNSFAFDDSGNVLALTNALHKFLFRRMDLQEPNFRLLSAFTGGKSYVHDDESLLYTVNNSTVSTESTAVITDAKSIRESAPESHKDDDDHVTIEIMSSSASKFDLIFTTLFSLILFRWF